LPREITGSAQLSGLPSALGTIGTAIAIAVLSGAMGRWGRRAGLVAGLASGVAGATVTVIAVAGASFPLLLAGSIAVGFGNAALQLSRYAASDLVAPERRAGAVGIVVWGSTAGAVLGPNLLQPAAAVGEWLGRGPLEGAMAATVLLFGLALLVVLVGVPGRRSALESAAPALPLTRLAPPLRSACSHRSASGSRSSG